MRAQTLQKVVGKHECTDPPARHVLFGFCRLDVSSKRLTAQRHAPHAEAEAGDDEVHGEYKVEKQNEQPAGTHEPAHLQSAAQRTSGTEHSTLPWTAESLVSGGMRSVCHLPWRRLDRLLSVLLVAEDPTPQTLASTSGARSRAGIQVAQHSCRAAGMQGLPSTYHRYTTVGRMNAVSEPAKEPMKPGQACPDVKISAAAPRPSEDPAK